MRPAIVVVARLWCCPRSRARASGSGRCPTCISDEAECDNQSNVGHEGINEEELGEISDNYGGIAGKMEEMVRDAISYDGRYTSAEFEKLKKMVRDMKTPL